MTRQRAMWCLASAPLSCLARQQARGRRHPDRLRHAASRIGEVIRQRRLTRAAAAELLEADQPKVSRLLRGHLTNFSAERLMRFLTLLGRDVEIVVKPAPRSRQLGRVRVVAAV